MGDSQRRRDEAWQCAARRALDIGVAGVLVVVTVPLLLAVMVGSAVALRAWPLFSHERIGRDGRVFRFVKVRTLPATTPAYLEKSSLAHQPTPPFCRWLRTLHLDELPQLYLVLRGHMSLVGPRPEMEFLHQDLDRDFAAERTSVRPGCTGLWQISDACRAMIADAPEFDRYYLTNRSIRFDAWIVARTMRKMVAPSRTIAFADIPTWTTRTATLDPTRRVAATIDAAALDVTVVDVGAVSVAGR